MALAASGCSGGKGSAVPPTASPPSASTARAAPVTTLAPIGTDCLTAAERTRTLRFRADDGAVIAAVVLGRGQTGIVLAHQVSASMCQVVPYGRELARLGYRVLALDLEGYGASTTSSGESEARYDADVVAAVEALREQGVTRVALVGASLGGTTVVTAAARLRPPVQAVVCLSGPSDYAGMDAAAAAARLTMPALFVGSAADPGAVESQRAMYGADHAAGHRLLVLPGPYHGVELLDPVDGADAVQTRAAVLAFLRAYAPA